MDAAPAMPAGTAVLKTTSGTHGGFSFECMLYLSSRGGDEADCMESGFGEEDRESDSRPPFTPMSCELRDQG